jgi:hypothetical protein
MRWAKCANQHGSGGPPRASQPVKDVAVTDELITFTSWVVASSAYLSRGPGGLSEATSEQRNNLEIIGDGQGVHWPEVDEDISVEGMLHGVPARRPTK